MWCSGQRVWLWIRCNLWLRIGSPKCHRLYLGCSYLPSHKQCFHSATFIRMYVHVRNSYHLYSDVISLNCDKFRRYIKPNYHYHYYYFYYYYYYYYTPRRELYIVFVPVYLFTLFTLFYFILFLSLSFLCPG